MKISICLCIKDGEAYMKYIDDLFTRIETFHSNIEFEYFIYENNSKDKTKELLPIFFKDRKGNYLSENVENSHMMSGISMQRGIHMANIRNKLKQYHGKLDSDYVLLLDTDVVLLPETINNLLDTMKHDIVMVTPYSICYDIYYKTNNYHYYDSLAVITQSGIDWKKNNNKCLFKSCTMCNNYRKLNPYFNNKKISNTDLLDDDKLIYVKSCFGSLALVKTDVYNKVKWGKSICEHHSFCEDILKYGRIVINPTIKTFTSQPWLRSYKNIEERLIKINSEKTIINQ